MVPAVYRPELLTLPLGSVVLQVVPTSELVNSEVNCCVSPSVMLNERGVIVRWGVPELFVLPNRRRQLLYCHWACACGPAITMSPTHNAAIAMIRFMRFTFGLAPREGSAKDGKSCDPWRADSSCG